MRKIEWRYEVPADIAAIVAAMADRGVEVSDIEAAVLWSLASQTVSATWLVTDGYDVADMILNIVDPKSEDPYWPGKA